MCAVRVWVCVFHPRVCLSSFISDTELTSKTHVNQRNTTEYNHYHVSLTELHLCSGEDAAASPKQAFRDLSESSRWSLKEKKVAGYMKHSGVLH